MRNKLILILVIFAFIIPVEAQSLSGYVLNTHNESIYNVSISLDGNHTHSNISGYYNFNNVSSGNYTLKAIRYPYLNKTVDFTMNSSDETLNITLNAKNVIPQPIEDNSPIYIIAILISFVAVASRHRQIEDIFEIIKGK